MAKMASIQQEVYKLRYMTETIMIMRQKSGKHLPELYSHSGYILLIQDTHD